MKREGQTRCIGTSIHAYVDVPRGNAIGKTALRYHELHQIVGGTNNTYLSSSNACLGLAGRAGLNCEPFWPQRTHTSACATGQSPPQNVRPIATLRLAHPHALQARIPCKRSTSDIQICPTAWLCRQVVLRLLVVSAAAATSRRASHDRLPPQVQIPSVQSSCGAHCLRLQASHQ